jgi:DNA-binding NtrC family response regulator
VRVEVEIAEGATHAAALRSFEAALFVAALNGVNCNRRKAAASLGMAYNTFLRRLAALDLNFQAGVKS